MRRQSNEHGRCSAYRHIFIHIIQTENDLSPHSRFREMVYTLCALHLVAIGKLLGGRSALCYKSKVLVSKMRNVEGHVNILNNMKLKIKFICIHLLCIESFFFFRFNEVKKTTEMSLCSFPLPK